MRQRMRLGRGDNGAAAVEFALLFPIFMVLVLGTISGGVAFSKQLTVTQAAREASRYGATYDVDLAAVEAGKTPRDLEPWLVKVRAAARAAAGGKDDRMGGYDDICVAYVETNGSTVDTAKSAYLTESAADDDSKAGACPGAPVSALQDTAYVQTVIVRKSTFFVLFLHTTLQLDSVSVTPYEARPVTE